MTGPELSRRQQNRVDALRAIHRAAYELTKQDGPASATVEAISRKAGVSARTFFNYYRSKEDAVLGIHPPQVHVDQLRALGQGGAKGLFYRVLILLHEVVRDSIVDGATFAHRKEIFELMPESKDRMRAHMSSCESAVQEAIVSNFDTGVFENEELSTQPDAQETARALIVLAGSAFRFTYERAPFDLLSPPVDRVAESVEIFSRILKETL